MNDETKRAYPLQWPPGWRRTLPHSRTRAKFGKTEPIYRVNSTTGAREHAYDRKTDLTVAEACARIVKALERMGVTPSTVVVSSNLMTRNDGMPRSSQRKPEDPGACVYWERKGATHCMPIDNYDRVHDNIAAIAATLDAMRTIERHGGAAILNRALAAFAALPNPEAWWQVLGLKDPNVTAEAIKHAHRRLASEHHPDFGGDTDLMARINRARDIGLQAVQE